jgi:hypothetical protein
MKLGWIVLGLAGVGGVIYFATRPKAAAAPPPAGPSPGDATSLDPNATALHRALVLASVGQWRPGQTWANIVLHNNPSAADVAALTGAGYPSTPTT